MLGPLPTFYRVLVWVCALGAFTGLGAWLASTLPVPVLPLTGAGVGAGLGVVAAVLMLHEPERRSPRPHRVRTGRHRRPD